MYNWIGKTDRVIFLYNVTTDTPPWNKYSLDVIVPLVGSFGAFVLLQGGIECLEKELLSKFGPRSDAWQVATIPMTFECLAALLNPDPQWLGGGPPCIITPIYVKRMSKAFELSEREIIIFPIWITRATNQKHMSWQGLEWHPKRSTDYKDKKPPHHSRKLDDGLKVETDYK